LISSIFWRGLYLTQTWSFVLLKVGLKALIINFALLQCSLYPNLTNFLIHSFVFRLLEWKPEALRGERQKHESVVVIKRLFNPEDIDKNPPLLLELQNLLRKECSKFGEVRKVIVHDVCISLFFLFFSFLVFLLTCRTKHLI